MEKGELDPQIDEDGWGLKEGEGSRANQHDQNLEKLDHGHRQIPGAGLVAKRD